MENISAKEIAVRLESLYKKEVESCLKYQTLVHGCKRWFSEKFDTPEQFRREFSTSDLAFVNILAACLKSNRRMIDFLSVCNPWAFWHFELSIRESIQTLKAQGTNTFYSVPNSDSSFLKKFSLPSHLTHIK